MIRTAPRSGRASVSARTRPMPPAITARCTPAGPEGAMMRSTCPTPNPGERVHLGASAGIRLAPVRHRDDSQPLLARRPGEEEGQPAVAGDEADALASDASRQRVMPRLELADEVEQVRRSPGGRRARPAAAPAPRSAPSLERKRIL